eukprot:g11429.t1 g11429   contig5:826938-828536(+)
MKRRPVSGSISPDHRQRHSDVEQDGHLDHNDHHHAKRRDCLDAKVVVCCVVLVVVSSIGHIITGIFKPQPPPSTPMQRRHDDAPSTSTQSSSTTNKFISTFEESLHLPAPYSIPDIAAGLVPSEDGLFVPLILFNGKLQCRIHHREKLIHMRSRAYIDMLQRGLKLNYHHSTSFHDEPMPILLMEGDDMGCNVALHTDAFPFPRTFANNERNFPWASKLNKAVWRGTTTHEQTQFRDSDFHDIPRAILVQKSIENPELIDAGFTEIIQKFEKQKEELTPQTIVTDRIPFDDQMRYKAIIDIDGNNWSSRFIRLLCTNSVVIKIEPDYIEYFYDDLRPNVHYLPASLDNVTDVTAYAMNEMNNKQMKDMVASANSWCKRTLTEGVLITDAMFQLDEYEASLEIYADNHGSWLDEWRLAMKRFSRGNDDLVECSMIE